MCIDAKIEIKNLARVYNNVTTVAGINLTVSSGSITGLPNPDGADKTSTLRMLAGILKPTSGSIKICGFDILTEVMKIKKIVDFLSADTQLYGHLP